MLDLLINGFCSTYKLISSNIIPSLIIFGWLIFIWNSNRILFRVEKKDLHSKIINLLKKLGEDGYKFWNEVSITKPEEITSKINKKQKNRIQLRKFLYDLSNIELYAKILKDYELNVLSTEDISKLKFRLTLNIENAHIKNRNERHTIINEFLSELTETVNKVENSCVCLHDKYSTISEIIYEVKGSFFKIKIFMCKYRISLIIFIILLVIIESIIRL